MMPVLESGTALTKTVPLMSVEEVQAYHLGIWCRGKLSENAVAHDAHAVYKFHAKTTYLYLGVDPGGGGGGGGDGGDHDFKFEI